MSHRLYCRAVVRSVMCGTFVLAAPPLVAQGQQGRALSPQIAEASRLDLDGQTRKARVILQQVLDTISEPAAKADAQRAMAMSFAFGRDCAHTVKYESLVIDDWRSREQADPGNAFYQEGEMADEAARVCLDAGDVDEAERWYRTGYERGLLEPPPQTHRKALWDFRLAHALGRIAARRGDTAEAHRQIEAARRALDTDSAMAAQQERFFPYLVGYVALYTHDLPTARAQFTKAIALKGNEKDPYLRCLLAMTDEQLGHRDDAMAQYRQAYDLATAHNPASAFARRYARAKLNLPVSGN